MKKASAIFLSLLVLFNALGFYGLFIGLEYNNKINHHALFDNNAYDESRAVTIKVPLSVPYASNQTDYQRVDGEFEYQGEFYRLVKQRLAHDTLHIICYKDGQSKRMHQALKDYVKTFSDKPVDAKNASKISVDLLKDYCRPHFSMINTSFGWSYTLQSQLRFPNLLSSYYHDIVHPPERG